MNRGSLSCRQIVTGIRVRAFVSSMGRVGAYAIRPYNLPAGNKMTLISGLARHAKAKMTLISGLARCAKTQMTLISGLARCAKAKMTLISGLAHCAKAKMRSIY